MEGEATREQQEQQHGTTIEIGVTQPQKHHQLLKKLQQHS
jgi:hypothetical protein